MNNLIVAVPSCNPGGMDAEVSSHFCHCDVYTIVEIADGKIAESKVIPSLPHGNCLAPISFLADKGVQALISGGMGMRPLAGFQQSGVAVFYGKEMTSVKQAIAALMADELPLFPAAAACGGSGSCGGHASN
ncbi:MAG: dinitrogenase iron-molybdenum cofactor biosynthesis protein [Deferribacteraceae bacterium]|jgi:predicted Fe-Mo cluster-binding NifX family protein|nr:dinitrogenase iron-molybdenum cofactor biosynthesis protein [Deferribacteraceae bacterium]